MARTARLPSLVVTLALLAGGAPALAAGAEPRLDSPPVPELDTGSASLSPAGKLLAARVSLADAPRYGLNVEIEPGSGRLRASMHASLPSSARNHLVFRMFAGLVTPDAHVRITDASVDGTKVDAELDDARVRLPDARSEGRVDVELSFSYRIPKAQPTDPLEALGEGLDPASIGLLARHTDVVTLGYWFPVWLPPGSVDVADPKGFGDIGNFPAAVISTQMTLPRGWKVYGAGTEASRERTDDATTIVEEGVGLRDMSFVIGRNLVSIDSKVGDVTIRGTVPPEARDDLEAALTETADALTVYSERFTPYPWSELDVIGVPLGGSVGGMEWPGAIWIGSSILAGGFPGLEDLPFPDLNGSDEQGGPLDDLTELLEGFGLGADTRAFTIAHEVAHQWWHAIVGNDSIAAPVIDEPLAQHSACVALRVKTPETDCSPSIELQYQAMRSFGVADAPADQSSDEFASSLQYGGVIYGKAPGFYRALEGLLGADAVTTGLAAFATAHAWGVATPDDLLAAFTDLAPDRASEITALWTRWMEEVHGDEDIGASATSFPGLDAAQLEELIRQLQELDALFPTTLPAR